MKSKLLLFTTFFTLLFFFDHASKTWAKSLIGNQAEPGQDTIFTVYAAYNSEGLLGLFPSFSGVLTIAIATFAVFWIVVSFREEINAMLLVALSLFMAGIFGNAIERIMHNKVTDWIFVYPGVILNLADLFIFLGLGMLLAFFFSSGADTKKQRAG